MGGSGIPMLRAGAVGPRSQWLAGCHHENVDGGTGLAEWAEVLRAFYADPVSTAMGGVWARAGLPGWRHP